jgi:hypothetical protein
MLLASDHQGSGASEMPAGSVAERERASAAVERWLLAELEMHRAASAAAGDNSAKLRAPSERIAASNPAVQHLVSVRAK